MTYFSLNNLLISFMFLVLANPLPAATSVAEAELERQIRQQISSQQLIELTSPEGAFVGIYRESRLPFTQGGVLIIHDLNQNANSPAIIKPLAETLADHGWDTLSLQMPVAVMDDAVSPFVQLERLYESLSTEAGARILSGVNYFLNNDHENLSVIGFGVGGKYALDQVISPQNEALINLVMINFDSLHPPTLLQSLETLNKPALDVFGSRTLQPIKSSISERRTAIVSKAENNNFRQVEIEGADHLFSGLENQLITTVRAWLGKNAKGMKITQ